MHASHLEECTMGEGDLGEGEGDLGEGDRDGDSTFFSVHCKEYN